MRPRGNLSSAASAADLGGLPFRGRTRGRGGGLGLGQDREHRPSLDERVTLDHGDVLEAVGHLLEKLTAKIGVGKLTTPEEDGDLDLIAVLKELDGSLRL